MQIIPARENQYGMTIASLVFALDKLGAQRKRIKFIAFITPSCFKSEQRCLVSMHPGGQLR